MKIYLIYMFSFLFCFSGFPECTGEQILRVLFPKIGTLIETDKEEGNSELFGHVFLRGMRGVIPCDEIQTVDVNDSVTVFAFMIYLTEGNAPEIEFEGTLNSGVEHKILLQCVFFNTHKQLLIGKPDGFPLEAKQWTCYGDICDYVSLERLTVSKVAPEVIIFNYTTGLENAYCMYLTLSGKNVLQTQPLKRGTTYDHANNLEMNVEYEIISKDGYQLSLRKNLQVDEESSHKEITVKFHKEVHDGAK